MRYVTAEYDSERFDHQASTYEVSVLMGSVVYYMESLKSIRIKYALYDGSGPKVGGVCSAQCELTLMEESANWPRMAKFYVQLDLIDHNGQPIEDSTLRYGPFFTDERHDDKHGNLTVIGYDAMLLLEQTWADKCTLPQIWPITARQAMDLLTEAIGVRWTYGDNEYGHTNPFNNYEVLHTPYIGLDTTSTARDLLKSIAVGCGCNCTMSVGPYHAELTPNEDEFAPNDPTAISQEVFADNSAYTPTIYFSPLQSEADYLQSSKAGVAIAGVSIVGAFKVLYPREAKIGTAVVDFEANEQFPPVTGVQVKSPDGTIAFAGDETGYVLKAECDFADTAIAQLCLNRVQGYVYRPFTAHGARIDPKYEINDGAVIGVDNEDFPIVTMDMHISKHVVCDLSAPFEEEVDHEFQTLSGSSKALIQAKGYAKSYTDKQIESTMSYIRSTAEAIETGVKTTYVNNADLEATMSAYSKTSEIEENYYNQAQVDEKVLGLSSTIEQTNSSWTAKFSEFSEGEDGKIEALTKYLKFADGVLKIGDTANRVTIRIGLINGEYQIGLFYDDTPLSYWNQNRQYTPQSLQIPVGGDLTISKIKFWPRDTGNMSLVWVG